jgi:hypothetical protein
MTASRPPDPVLSGLDRRFPDRLHLWVGSVRLWRAELPVRQTGSASRLAVWVARASALGPAEVARRLGLPEPVVAAAGRPVRRAFAFLDLPGGPVPVPAPPESLPTRPEPVSPDGVPPAVLRPPGVEVTPVSADWRTVPVVRAERVNAVAVGRADGIAVYAARPGWELGDSPAWGLPADGLPAATAEHWAAAWREWCRERGVAGASLIHVENGVARVRVAAEAPGGWLLAGGGPLWDVAVIAST